MLIIFQIVDISIHTVPKDSDFVPVEAADAYHISIHTVPKDSDFRGGYNMSRGIISIHTVPKDSDLLLIPIAEYLHHFNPHRPEGQ